MRFFAMPKMIQDMRTICYSSDSRNEQKRGVLFSLTSMEVCKLKSNTAIDKVKFTFSVNRI